MNPSLRKRCARLGAAVVLGLSVPVAADAADSTSFKMRRGSGLPAGCAPNATADVRIETLGFAERMTVSLSGMPRLTEFDLFTIQVPEPPFGVGWYVGDLKTNAEGKVTRSFVGRFSEETFALAVGSAPAPQPHPGDAATNPVFKPVHTYHLGLWFNAPADAGRAGCPNFTTPFNGEHNAGLQVLNTGQFGIKAGPLRRID